MKQILLSLFCINLIFGSCTYSIVPEIEEETISLAKEIDQQQEIILKQTILLTPENSVFKETEVLTSQADSKLCQSKAKIAKEPIAQRLSLSHFKPDEQQFGIDPTEDNVITTDKGVQFIIPKKSFKGSKKIVFSVTEYFGKTAAYTQKLTTETADGGLLESAGMFDLAAEINGVPIQLEKGAEIILKMPEVVPAGMNVYYGEENKNGDVVWNKDEHGTELTPVVFLKKGFFKLKVASHIENNYKFDKATMLELLNKEWTTRVSFDTDGNVIGYTQCNDSTKARLVACEAFFDLLNNSDPIIFKYHIQKTDVGFTFECISKKEYIARQTRQKTGDVFANAFSDFEPTMNGKPRKYFSIGALGPINIDKDIRLPEAKKLRPLLVKVGNNKEEIKLLFKEKNTMVSAVQRDGYYIFNRMPRGAKVVVVSTYAKGDKAFLASQSHIINDTDNRLTLAYEAVKTEDLAAKLDEICQ